MNFWRPECVATVRNRSSSRSRIASLHVPRYNCDDSKRKTKISTFGLGHTEIGLPLQVFADWCWYQWSISCSDLSLESPVLNITSPACLRSHESYPSWCLYCGYQSYVRLISARTQVLPVWRYGLRPVRMYEGTWRTFLMCICNFFCWNVFCHTNRTLTLSCWPTSTVVRRRWRQS